MPTWAALSFPDSNSPLAFHLNSLHNHTMLIMLMVTIMILYSMISTLLNSNINKFLLEGQELETIWTSIPAVLLVMIAFPSLKLLYLMEEQYNPYMTIKIIGHQWYWSYQYSDFNNIEFDSFMLENNLINSFRLLDVNNRFMIPISLPIRLIITSNDVIHSWTIPSQGIKADATPGRLNQTMILSTRPGVYFGQCSEICGAKHSFMPISMECISINSFLNWLSKM